MNTRQTKTTKAMQTNFETLKELWQERRQWQKVFGLKNNPYDFLVSHAIRCIKANRPIKVY